MSLSIFKVFSIFGTVSAWSEKALDDGVVTVREAADLGITLAEQLGLPTEIKVVSHVKETTQGDEADEDVEIDERMETIPGPVIKPEE